MIFYILEYLKYSVSILKKWILKWRFNFKRIVRKKCSTQSFFQSRIVVFNVEEVNNLHLLVYIRQPFTWWHDVIEQVWQRSWHPSPYDGNGQVVLQESPVYPGGQAETRSTTTSISINKTMIHNERFLYWKPKQWNLSFFRFPTL